MNCVLFDLGYTLIYNIKHELYQVVLQNAGRTFPLHEVDAALQKTDAYFMHYFPGLLLKPPDSYQDAYLTAVNYYLGFYTPVRPLADAYIRALKETPCIWRLYPDTYSVLRTLRQAGLRLGLVTNWGKSCRKVLAQMGLTEYFDSIVISSEKNIEKPDPRLFQSALEQLDTQPQEALFVGDNYMDDGVGSERAGIPFVILNRRGDDTHPLSCHCIDRLSDLFIFLGLEK